jgi:transcriptional regulator with XRE-family HTH domain
MNLSDRQFLEAVGFRIRELRSARGMTQAELAAATGLHRTFIGAVERGERNVALLNLRKIALALRARLPALFDDVSRTTGTDPAD